MANILLNVKESNFPKHDDIIVYNEKTKCWEVVCKDQFLKSFKLEIDKLRNEVEKISKENQELVKDTKEKISEMRNEIKEIAKITKEGIE